jgi:hypothetical protein
MCGLHSGGFWVEFWETHKARCARSGWLRWISLRGPFPPFILAHAPTGWAALKGWIGPFGWDPEVEVSCPLEFPSVGMVGI